MAGTDASQLLLRVKDVAVHFGGIVALDGVSFDVARGQIVGLIGPNGAGKTTLFNCLSRLYPLDRGDIEFEGASLLELPIHRIAEAGIGRTFQNLALFRTMTVLQNIMAGGHSHSRGGFFANALRLPLVQREEQGLHAEAMKIVSLLELDAVTHARVMDLPFGTQKRVELGRALAAKPKLLLLDEPAGGLNHEEVGALAELMKHVRNALGVTILLVEHHMSLVMSTSDRVVALNFGRKIAEGTPAEVQGHADVISAYLGTTH